jgi:hypothetical protein
MLRKPYGSCKVPNTRAEIGTLSFPVSKLISGSMPGIGSSSRPRARKMKLEPITSRLDTPRQTPPGSWSSTPRRPCRSRLGHTQAHPFRSICGRRKRTHNHSGRPALRRPLANVVKSSARRNGAKSLRLDPRKLGSHSSARDMALCPRSSRPASALLAAEMHIASRKAGLSRIAFSAHDDAMS